MSSDPRVANRNRDRNANAENNYWEMTWNMKQNHLYDWWPKAQIRFDFLGFDEHNLFCKTLLQSSALSPFQHGWMCFGWLQQNFESGKWSDYEMWSHTPKNTLLLCFFHFIFILFCVTWQLRATTWCVNPFVTVVTKAMIQKHNLVITTNRKFDTKTLKLPQEWKTDMKRMFISQQMVTALVQM